MTDEEREMLLETPAALELLTEERQALADAIGAMTAHELLAGMSGEARQVCQARDRIAEAVRSRLLVPLVDQWGNVVGHRFRNPGD